MGSVKLVKLLNGGRGLNAIGIWITCRIFLIAAVNGELSADVKQIDFSRLTFMSALTAGRFLKGGWIFPLISGTGSTHGSLRITVVGMQVRSTY